MERGGTGRGRRDDLNRFNSVPRVMRPAQFRTLPGQRAT